MRMRNNSSNGMTKVSIIMCTYNGVPHLSEQLDSLRAQTLPPYELVVQDDGSSDGTWELLEDFCRTNPDLRIRLFRNPQRLGYNRNFLSAVQRAEGDLIACCDQDDVWHPEKLETLVREIGNAPLVFHNSMLMDNGHNELGLLHTHPLPPLIPSLGAVLYPRGYGHQLVFRHELLPMLAAFTDEEISYDYLIYTVAAARGTLHYVHQPLVWWRRHTQATTYNPQAQKTGRWDGYIHAIEALRKNENRERTRRYFTLLQDRLPCRDARVARIVHLLAKGSLTALLAACRLSLRHSRESVPDVHKAHTRCLRAFFLPLFFIRDHGRYIIRL